MKTWHMENFALKVGAKIAMARINDFANKHKLKPGEFKIGPVDDEGVITVLYYSAKRLHK